MFDFVIIDSPPLLPVTDAAILAKKSDGVILVARAGKTRVGQFKGSKDSLEAVGATILGAILNMIPVKARDYDNYGYRYGHSYGYGRKGGRKYGKEYGDYVPAGAGRGAAVPVALAPLPSESEKLELGTPFRGVIGEKSSAPSRLPRTVSNPTIAKSVRKKATPEKVAKQGVEKASTIKKRAPGKSLQ